MPAVPISTFVNVAISIAEGAVKQQGFGVPMIVGQSTVLGASEVLTATGAQSWVDAGGATTDEEYKALAALFSATPTVQSAKVCRRSADTAAVQRIAFAADFQSGGTVSIIFTYTDLAGSTVTETVSQAFSSSHSDTITAVTAALLAFDIVTAASGTNTAPGARFDITIDPSLSRSGLVTFTTAAVTGTGAQTATTSTQTLPVTLTDRLDTLAASEDGSWFFLLLTHTGTDAVRTMDSYRAAAWVEANTIDAVYVAQHDLSTITAGTSGNIAKVLKAAGYNRSHVVYHPEAEYAAATLVGRGASQDLDVSSIDWWRLRLPGITAQDFTPTQRATLDADYVGYYTTSGGIGIYLGGRMASGRYIDQQLTLDWFATRLAEDVDSYLQRGADSNIKRTYTDATTADAEGLLRKRWANGVRANHFAATKTENGDTVEALTVVRGAVASESAGNRSARLYAGLSATIPLAGSIRAVNPITIVLEV